jgi:hypothetical protein
MWKIIWCANTAPRYTTGMGKRRGRGRPKDPNSLRSLGVDRHAQPRKCFHAPDALIARLAAYCKRTKASESQVIRDALGEFLVARKA